MPLCTTALGQQTEATTASHPIVSTPPARPQAHAIRISNADADRASSPHDRNGAHIHAQARRSKRLQAMASSQQTRILAAARMETSPTQNAQPLAQCTHSPPRASRKRRASEPFHMSLRRPTARQRTAQVSQPSLMNAYDTESASEWHSSMSPLSSSGLPFDPG